MLLNSHKSAIIYVSVTKGGIVMQFVAIPGTDADHSYNRMLLQFMQQHFKKQANIEICEIADVPMFNEDDPDPEAIKLLAAKITEADGVIIGCPEYDHSLTSMLKSVLEWCSYRIHPLKDKPVMIVGASTKPQGSSRAQIHLRQVLDSPGVDARVLPSNEFLLGNTSKAFDDTGNLKDAKTVQFLEQCFDQFVKFGHFVDDKQSKKDSHHQKEIKKMKVTSPIRWDATYDVVVLGFGGAGATAARFAADDGAKVLLVDSAPEGHEGGNTRYAGQIIASGDDADGLKKYHRALAAPLQIDEDQLDTFVEGLVNMQDYIKQAFGTEPYSFKKDPDANPMLKALIAEYPELPGADSYDDITVHKGFGDSGLWKELRKAVLARSDKINVWYSSPARHLYQAPDGTVIGVQIERAHVLRNIRALNGVVLATGGFENNKQMIQDYLGEDYLAPIGTLYNKGIGIKLAQEVGAELVHMHSYEALGMMHGLSIRTEEGKRGQGAMASVFPELTNGSVFTVGTDGTRYFKEDAISRHGKINDHGTSYRAPVAQTSPYIIFDQTQYNQLAHIDFSKLPLALKGIISKKLVDSIINNVVKAESIELLANKIHKPAVKLSETLEEFNYFADHGKDYAFHRDPKSLRHFDDGPYYALPVRQNMLNTQGGARRNSRTEVLDPNGHAIPNLYEAGELGALFVNQYNGGGNLAELLIFGKIAGENAAVPKQQPNYVMTESATAGTDTVTHTDTFDTSNDEAEKTEFSVGPNQALGHSDAGMGGEIVTRVTVDDAHNLKNVEILQESESDDVAASALKKLPQEMVKKNTYEVDAVSGASRTSQALRDAVQDALAQLN